MTRPDGPTQLFASGEPAPLAGLVSVIMPLYNHARFVAEALESVARLDHADLELLVLDDGSKDGSAAVALRWMAANASRFRRVELWSSPNQGVCRTLNFLVGRAAGEFVQPLASDDRLRPAGLDGRLAALRTDPLLLAVFSDARLIDDQGHVLADSVIRARFHGNRAALANPRQLRAELTLRWCVPGPSVLVRRSAYGPAGIGRYNESVPAEDRDFFLRLLDRRAVRFVAGSPADYRAHSGSTSGGSFLQRNLRPIIWESNRAGMVYLRGYGRLVIRAGLAGYDLRQRRKAGWVVPFAGYLAGNLAYRILRDLQTTLLGRRR